MINKTSGELRFSGLNQNDSFEEVPRGGGGGNIKSVMALSH